MKGRLFPMLSLAALATFAACAPDAIAANNGMPLSTVGETNGPIIVSGDNGGSYAFWTASDGLARAQRLSSANTLATEWGPSGLSFSGYGYRQIAGAPDGYGGVFVVLNTFGPSIILYHLNESGRDYSWPGLGLSIPESRAIARPRICKTASGEAMCVWADPVYGLNVQKLTLSGVAASWPATGRTLGIGGGDQTGFNISPDGTGGIFITWAEDRGYTRSNGYDIYAQRVLSDGSLAPSWPSTGLLICGANGTQVDPVITTTDAGNIVVAWRDDRNGSGRYDVYARKVLPTGAFPPSSPTNGIPVCIQPADQTLLGVKPVQSDGAIVTWQDDRSGSAGLFAQYIKDDFSLDSSYPADGASLCDAPGAQYELSIERAAPNGIWLAWRDDRSGTHSDVYARYIRIVPGTPPSNTDNGIPVCDTPRGYHWQPMVSVSPSGTATIAWNDSRYGFVRVFAQRITSSGTFLLPDTEIPVTAGARDVPGDQGGKVKLNWTSSTMELLSSSPSSEYWVWRSVPPNAPASLTQVAQPRPIESVSADDRDGIFTTQSATGVTRYWEFYAAQPNGHLDGYSMTCRTEMDSLATGNPLTYFMVQWRSNDASNLVISSEPDSGYSVDNLSPPLPLPFTAKFTPLENMLHWLPSKAPDFSEFKIYRSPYPSFPPSSTLLLASTRDTGYVDHGGAYYYKLVAVDVHGNISRAAVVSHSAPTSALASIVETTSLPDRIRVRWFLADGPGTVVQVQRRTPETDWTDVGTVSGDGSGLATYEDTDVATGARYRYRLGVTDETAVVFVGETSELSTALPLTTALGAFPNPATSGRIRLQFALAGGPAARLELFDLFGRQLASESFPAGSSGAKELEFGGTARLKPGLYLVRLTQGQTRKDSRVVVLD